MLQSPRAVVHQWRKATVTDKTKIYSLITLGFLLGMTLFVLRGGMMTGGDSAALDEAANSPMVRAQAMSAPLTKEQDDLSKMVWLDAQAAKGKVGSVNSLDTQMTLVTFWATWCRPCQREWPSMLRLANILGKDKLRIVSISEDENNAVIEDFFRGIEMPEWGSIPDPDLALILRDPNTTESEMMKTRYGTRQLPETYLIIDGRIRYKFVNERDWTHWEMRNFFERLGHARR